MFSKAGASKLEQAFANKSQGLHVPNHIDWCLKEFFSQAENDWMCYLAPPCAGYESHVSGCSSEWLDKPRPDVWDEPWACTGTRESHDWHSTGPRPKWLCTLTKNGRCQYLARCNIEVLDYMVAWRTYDARRLQAMQSAETSRQKRAKRADVGSLKFRHWVDDAAEVSTMLLE
jgi:hypothetical protein